MNSVRAVLRALRIALLAVLPASSLFSQTLVNDSFSDGNRTGQTPPSSVNWFVNTGSTVSTTTSVGSMALSNGASRLMMGYFAAAPVTLTSGQSLTLELAFRSDVTPASITNGFNLALFNSAGSRISADFSGTSNAAFASYDGYGVKTSGLGSTAGSSITLRQRNAGTSTSPMSTSGDWTTLATGSGTTPTASANIDYVATLTVLNNGSTVSLGYTLKTADGLTTLHTLTATDSSSLVTAFDAVALYLQTAAFPSGNLIVTGIKISVTGGAAPAAPSITGQPQNKTVNADDSATFSVTASGTAPLSYQWFKDTVVIPGATSSSFTLAHAQSGDQGSYTVTVTNAAGSATSDPATLTVVTTSIAPSITTPPLSQTVNVGDPVTFTVVATGSAPLSYVWFKGTDPIPGAMGASYNIASAQTSDEGSYSVVVTNAAGSAEGGPASLTVKLVAPSITKQPTSQTLGIGSSTTLMVIAAGTPPLSYQWLKNGVSIVGATGATLALNNVQLSDSADYTVTVSNSVDSISSNPATITVLPAASGALSRFNLTGFATVGAGTTGGGVIPESDPAYVKVTNALELATALISASKTAGSVKVIEIMNDLDLGWNEIGSAAQSLSSNPFRSHAAPKLHPVLLVTGMSLLDIKPKSGLTIFSANGATIRHCNLNIKGASNVIVRNLKFDEAWEWDEATKGNYDSNDWDFITLSNGSPATNIWIDHCTFTKAYDGILDQKAGTQYVTISWCKYIGDDGATNPNSWVRQQIAVLEANRPAYPFYNFLRTNGFSVEDIVQIIQGHDKTHLMGSNSLDADNNTLSATFHHLWLNSVWDRCVPRLRGGNVHDYNLYVDDTNVLAAKRLRDQRAAALSTSLRNTLNSTYSFNPPINGAISTENGALLLERSAYVDCLWPLRNNQTDVTQSIYTGKIQALDTIYVFHNTDGTIVNVRGNSTDAGNPMGPFQAPIIPFAWNLPNNVLPYTYTADDPAQLPDILAEGAGAGRVVWAKQNWLKTSYVDEITAPSIVTAPANTTATVGDDVTFTVAATGTGPLSYQWLFGADPIPGATSATLTLNHVLTSAAGSYSVTVHNAAGTITAGPATLTVNKAAAAITLSGLDTIYDGSTKTVSASTTPAGLSVAFTYDGQATAPINAGSYLVNATVVDADYQGSASATLNIAKAPASVALSGLNVTYDGAPKPVTSTTSPDALAVSISYDGSSTAPTNAGSYAVIAIVNDPNYSGSASGTLTIAKASAGIAFGALTQPYTGSPVGVTTTTTPPGLTVALDYEGSVIPPIYPGSHALTATVVDSNYSGTAQATLVITITALVRHGPTINGDLDGSSQLLMGENVTLNNGGGITGDLLVPGTPSIQLNGSPTYGGTTDALGSATPTGYTITLNNGSLLRHVVRRIDPLLLPTVELPPLPTGTRNIVLSGNLTYVGDFGTVRNLTVNAGALSIAVPAGTYGDFTANSGASFILGVAGASTPSLYRFQNLVINSSSKIKVVGPVIVISANGLALNGGTIGAADHPGWTELRLATGSLTLNGSSRVSAIVTAPAGSITINNNAVLHGRVNADQLIINGTGLLQDDSM